MNATLIELAEHRATLVAKIATQRSELEQALAPWRAPLAAVDQGIRVVRHVGRHPELLVGMAVFAAVLHPRRVSGWLRRSWVMWSMALALKRRLSG